MLSVIEGNKPDRNRTQATKKTRNERGSQERVYYRPGKLINGAVWGVKEIWESEARKRKARPVSKPPNETSIKKMAPR